MKVGILGPLHVSGDAGVVEVASAKQRALLTLLATHVGEVVSTDRIMHALWGDEQPTAGLKTLRYHVSKLRETIGDAPHRVIVTRPPGYVLAAEACQVDAAMFRAGVADARACLESDPGKARALVADALRMWRGPALAEFEFREFARSEARSLEEERLSAIELRIQAELALGRHDEVIGELEALVDEHPYREALRGLLITALYRAGRQAEALRSYQQIRRLLGDELGIEPSPELAALEERVLLHDDSIAPPQIGTQRTNLPAPLTRFIGRARALAEVAELIAGERLVTVTGPGGSGKTRLALEVAAGLTSHFPDGAWLVELAPLSAATEVAPAIADTLGVQWSADRDPADALASAMAPQHALVVLDNFEHVIEAAPLVARLLQVAPDVRMLVTSRERLRVSGEHVYRGPPLDPADAVALFIDHAQAASPGFDIDDDTTNDVTAICNHLGGLPLAIELAAARTDVLPLQALREHLNSRLATLTGGARDHPPRQQTLRNTIDWSYELLTSDERRLFVSMAVFRGGCSLDAVEAACSPDLAMQALDGLQSLTDKSLVYQCPGPDGEARFYFLETVHEYARELLAETMVSEPLRSRHCDYFVALADDAAPHLLNEFGQDRLRATLTAEVENLHAALQWAFAGGDPVQGCRLLGSLHFYWPIGPRSGLGDWEDVAVQHIDALEPLARARLYLALGRRGGGQQNVTDARSDFSQALEWARAADDSRVAAGATINLATTYVGDQRHYDHAMGLCRRALEEARAAGAPRLVVRALNAAGELARSLGEDETAANAYGEALEIARQNRDERLANLVRLNLSFIAGHRGDHQAAENLARRVLSFACELDDPTGTAWGLGACAVAAIGGGRVHHGAKLLGAAERAHTVIGIAVQPADRPEYDRANERLAEQLDPNELATLLAEGRAMTSTDAVAYALVRSSLTEPTSPL